MKKKYGVFIVIALIILTIPQFIYSIYYNNIKVRELRNENLKLKQEYDKLKEEKDNLLKDVENANTNYSIEKYARDKLNMSKDGERVYKIENKKDDKK